MKKSLLGLFLFLGLFSAVGCTWVKESEESRQVVILPADRVGHCTRIGEVNASVKDSIIGIDRNREKVQTELDRLAKNQAVSLRANTLVRMSVDDGTANYAAYRCPVSN